MDKLSVGQASANNAPLPLCRNCIAMGQLVAVMLAGLFALIVMKPVDSYWLSIPVLALFLAFPVKHAWFHYALKDIWQGHRRSFKLKPVDALDRMEAVVHSLEARKLACQLYRSNENLDCSEGYIECLLVLGDKIYGNHQLLKMIASVSRLDTAGGAEVIVDIVYKSKVPIWSDRSDAFLPDITNTIFLELTDPQPFWFADVPEHALPSPSHRARVQAYYLNLPRQVRLLLMRQGSRIAPVRRIIDIFPEFVTKTPTGYGDGHTYENCVALYSSTDRIIMIAQEYKRGGCWTAAEDSYIAQSVEHEAGHALDHALGIGGKYFSHSDEFAIAYERDRSNLPPDAVAKLKYYLQDGLDGREETFADIFNSVSLSWNDADYIEATFPLTTEVIKCRLKSIEVELAPNRLLH